MPLVLAEYAQTATKLIAHAIFCQHHITNATQATHGIETP